MPSNTPDGQVAEDNASESTHETMFVDRGSIRKVLISLCLRLVAFAQAFQSASFCVTMPGISKSLDMSLSDSYSLATTFLLALTVAQPFGSELASISGRRPTFLFALALFTTGTAICGLAKNSTMLWIGLAIQGTGAGVAEPVKNFIFSDFFDIHPKWKLVAYKDVPWWVGIMLGPVLGGCLAREPYLNWQWSFWIILPVLAVSALGISFLLGPKSESTFTWDRLKRVNLGSLFAFTIGSSTLFMGLVWGGTTFEWDSGPVVGMLCASASCYILLIVCERFASWWDPIFRSSALRLLPCLHLFQVLMHNILMWMTLYFMAIYYLQVRRLDALMASVNVLLITLPMAAIALAVGIFAARTSHTVLPYSWLLALNAYNILYWALDRVASYGILVGVSIATGICIGVFLQTTSTTTQANIEKHDERHALYMECLFRAAGQTISLPVGAAIFFNMFNKLLEEQNLSEDTVQGLLDALKKHGNDTGLRKHQQNIITPAAVGSLQTLWVVGMVLGLLALVLRLISKFFTDNTDRQSQAETLVGSNEPEVSEAQSFGRSDLPKSGSFLLEEGSETGTLNGSYMGFLEPPEVRGDPSVPPTIRFVPSEDPNPWELWNTSLGAITWVITGIIELK